MIIIRINDEDVSENFFKIADFMIFGPPKYAQKGELYPPNHLELVKEGVKTQTKSTCIIYTVKK